MLPAHAPGYKFAAMRSLFVLLVASRVLASLLTLTGLDLATVKRKELAASGANSS